MLLMKPLVPGVVWPHFVWRFIGHVLVLLGVAGAACSARSQIPTEQPRHFVMAGDASPSSLAYRLTLLIGQEAFRRLGATMEITNMPLGRRNALVEAGAIDGEMARIYSYGDAHPELVRVEESIMDFTFSLFTSQPGLQIQQLSDLPAHTATEFRRGILMCENKLRPIVAPEHLSTVTATEQGLKKLLAGRTDVYCDIATFVEDVRLSGTLKDANRVRKLLDVATVPTYPYVYKKHAALAPRLAAVLKQMKAQGLFAVYRKQAEVPVGARP